MIRIHAAAYSGRSQEPLFPAAPNARLRRCLQRPDRQRSLRMRAWPVSWVLRFSRDRSLLSLLWPACNARRFYAQRPLPPLDTSDEWGPQSQCGPMKKSRFGDWQLQKAFPPHLLPETEADRTPRASLLACMTASREQSNQGLELTGRRRFALRAVASCSHTGLRSDLSVEVLLKQLHDQLLLCFRLG